MEIPLEPGPTSPSFGTEHRNILCSQDEEGLRKPFWQ